MESTLRCDFRTLIYAGMIALAGFGKATAQGTDPVWLDELKAQIYQDEKCDANYFLDVQEFRLGDSIVYEARVQCVDGRQFDAKRTGEISPFVISACQPVVC